MTVLPGSLDYLYYNGILDHIPYEAYEMPAVNQNSYAENPYMNSAMSGSLYKNHGQVKDMFNASSDYTNPYRVDKNSYMSNPDDDSMSVRKEIMDGKDITKEKVMTKSNIIKGAAGVLIMLGTLFFLIKGKGKKKP